MNVAQIAPIWYRIPPKKYGGTERVVSLLTDGLVKKGINTTLFATKDSITKAKLKSIIDKGLIELGYNFSNTAYPLCHIINALQEQNFFDIIHLHFTSKFDWISLALARPFKNKTIVTLHTPLPVGRELVDKRKLLEEKLSDLNYVSISNSQRKDININFIETVYNGIELSEFPFSRFSSNELLWLSRISPEKGTLEAIQIAQLSKRKIIISGRIEEYDKQRYKTYYKSIKAYEGKDFVTFKGEVYLENKTLLYQQARVFIFPLQWEEPFGLVLTEAMACGTPVIAYARGAIPEIIKDGETGFTINASQTDKRGDFIVKKTGIEGFVEAIERIYAMSNEEYEVMRCASRAHVENMFTVERMVNNYHALYRKIVSKNK